MKSYVSQSLGNPSVETQQAVTQFGELTAELRRIAALATDLATVHDFTRRLEQAGATRFAERLRSIPVGESGEDRVLPTLWREAWTWSRVSGHLESIEARNELIGLASRRRDLEAGLARLYRGRAGFHAAGRGGSPLLDHEPL